MIVTMYIRWITKGSTANFKSEIRVEQWFDHWQVNVNHVNVYNWRKLLLIKLVCCLLQWYKQNRELKRKSSVLMQRVMQVAPETVTDLGDETDNSSSSGETDDLEELRKTVQGNMNNILIVNVYFFLSTSVQLYLICKYWSGTVFWILIFALLPWRFTTLQLHCHKNVFDIFTWLNL